MGDGPVCKPALASLVSNMGDGLFWWLAAHEIFVCQVSQHMRFKYVNMGDETMCLPAYKILVWARDLRFCQHMGFSYVNMGYEPVCSTVVRK